MTRRGTEANQNPEDGALGRFQTLAKALIAVPNAEVQAALAEEKRVKGERKRAVGV